MKGLTMQHRADFDWLAVLFARCALLTFLCVAAANAQVPVAEQRVLVAQWQVVVAR